MNYCENDIIKAHCQSDLVKFTDFSFSSNGKKFDDAEHFVAINNALKRVSDRKTQRLIINIPLKFWLKTDQMMLETLSIWVLILTKMMTAHLE